MEFLLWDLFAHIIRPKVVEYIQAHMAEGGSMPVYKHRLGQTVYLNAFSQGHCMAIPSLHQFSTPTYSCSRSQGGWCFSQHAPWRGQQSVSGLMHYHTFTLTGHLEFEATYKCFKTGRDRDRGAAPAVDQLCCWATFG